ncbi:MAG: 16S rRNA (uracil(1498)-N(3))-methyltransferase [Alphaproteobacteria bacterium]
MSNKFVPRIYIEAELFESGIAVQDQAKAHYLRTVMRLNVGSEVFLFNETDGEFLAKIKALSKSSVEFEVAHCVREPYMGADVTLLTAPIHKDNFRFIIEKGTELGVRHFQPVITEFTNAPKVRIDKANEHALNAAEQCERLDIPKISQPEKLSTIMRRWDTDKPIVYCCERGGKPIAEISEKIEDKPLTVLIGPEGGFSEEEHKWLSSQKHIHPISLGPRIMRAETATIAVLSALQSSIGDWDDEIIYIG